MQFLRLEVYNKDAQLIFVREKPIFTDTNRAIKTQNTKLTNWAMREFHDEWHNISVKTVEK